MEYHRESRIIAAETRKTKHLSSEQFQICLGGLLGDSSISPRKNGECRIRFGHSEDKKEYLEWKREIMGDFIVSKSPTISLPSEYGLQKQNFLVYESIQHDDFKRLYTLSYSPARKKRNKTITWKALSMLNGLGVLIWYLDDGTLAKTKGNNSKSNYIMIRTDFAPLSEQRTIKRWFWQKYKIDIKIGFDKTHDTYYIRLNTQETKQLMELFEPFIQLVPECMQYKFPEEYRYGISTTTRQTLATVKI